MGHSLDFRHTYRGAVKHFLGAPMPTQGKIRRMLTYSPQKIIALRTERGWNQSELARRAGISSPSLWALENGRTKMPKFETIKSVAAALGVPMSKIMADEADPDLDTRIAAAVAALQPANKNAVLAAAEALLRSQGRKPK